MFELLAQTAPPAFDWTSLFQGNNIILIVLAFLLFKDQILAFFKPKPAPVVIAPPGTPPPVVVAPTPAPVDRPLVDALVALIPTLVPILLPLITEALKPKVETVVKEQLAASK